MKANGGSPKRWLTVGWTKHESRPTRNRHFLRTFLDVCSISWNGGEAAHCAPSTRLTGRSLADQLQTRGVVRARRRANARAVPAAAFCIDRSVGTRRVAGTKLRRRCALTPPLRFACMRNAVSSMHSACATAEIRKGGVLIPIETCSPAPGRCGTNPVPASRMVRPPALLASESIPSRRVRAPASSS
jgi:hypothetical protein